MTEYQSMPLVDLHEIIVLMKNGFEIINSQVVEYGKSLDDIDAIIKYQRHINSMRKRLRDLLYEYLDKQEDFIKYKVLSKSEAITAYLIDSGADRKFLSLDLFMSSEDNVRQLYSKSKQKMELD